MQAGQFPYRTHPSNSSTAIFGLPEMMSIGALSRPAGGSSTVTVTTVAAHGLTSSDMVYVTSGTTNMNVTCAAISVTSTTTFTYTSGGTGSTSINGSYRKCVAGSWTRSSSTVTVSTTGSPGLVVGDSITVAPASSFTAGVVTVTAVGGSSFQYTSSTGTGTIAGFWVRTGLYNRGAQPSGPAVAYSIVPIEYCSDPNLTNCVYVLPGNTPPAGFTLPAYVRFCQTQAQALAHGGIGDASGTPRCRSKYNETSGITQYVFPRYGLFQRDTIVSSVSSYANRPSRSDCAAAPSCTYAEELNNYATWYTYYRTRLQMMKSSVGIAFVPFIGSPSGTPPKPNAIRLGFITMHAQDSGSISTTGNKYLRIQDFDTTQATNFYNKFYANTAGNSTPLQEALARAGWIFAGKLNTGLTSGIPTSDDPIQAACQRNYTLLTTDGFWNNLSSSLPKTPANVTIGNLDETPTNLLNNVLVDRAVTTTLDGTGSTSTTFTPSGTQSEQVLCQGNNIATFPTLGGPTNCGCTPKQHAVIQQDLTSGTTTTFANGVQTGSTTTTNQQYTNVSGCVDGNWQETDTPQTVMEDKVCKRSGSSNVVFSDGTSASCSACSSNRYVIIRETKTQTQAVITVDGVQTQSGPTGLATVLTYSTNGTTFTASPPSGGACANSAPTITLTPNPQTTNGAVVTTGATGTALAVWSPNPQSVTGGLQTSTFSGSGTANTVADTALYYFQTKLRGGTDVNGNATGPINGPNTIPPNTVDLSTNSIPVKPGAKDFIPYQHMVTFGIGLADGLMRFQPDYLTANSGDYFNINNGSVGACFWTAGACNWPSPADNTSANLDDLWHAAVNGRGSYFQALNADALSKGLSTVLASVNAQVAAAAASATSSPNVTQTSNQIFSTTYETNTWSGSVFAQKIDPVSGAVLPAILWTAEGQLVTKANANQRRIFTFDTSASSTKVKVFQFSSLDSTVEQPFFSNLCGTPPKLGQCSSLTGGDLSTANDGTSVVNFLRGDQTFEGTVFRDRQVIDPITGAVTQTVLGDTVSAKPVFVQNPRLSYSDAVTPSYSTYALANANRSPRVYVGANDGFLHAFDSNTGDESWAYAPRFLMPNLYLLADTGYASKHQFFVDGSPEAFDVFDTTASAWKTVLIGGAGGGGRGWYALDVTDPVNPKALWEFCVDPGMCSLNDPDLGYSFGNPIVGKRPSDGRWVVVLTSGLNNIPGQGGTTGSGNGIFYVLDAITGTILSKVNTNAGTGATPAGLMKQSGFYNSALTDATVRFIYAGDQLGNMWRLDLGSASGTCDAPATGSAPCVSHLATLTDGTSPVRVQPITTRPQLTLINTSRVIYFGTGRYIGDGLHGGVSDLSDPGSASGISWLQSFYGVKDRNFDYGALRSDPAMVQQFLSLSGTSDRNVTNNPVNWATNDGWLVDFIAIAADPTSVAGGERVNIDPRLVLGTLVVLTNTPASGGTCSAGGSSRVYNFDYLTGGCVGGQCPAGQFLGDSLAVGQAITQNSSGQVNDTITQSDTDKPTLHPKIKLNSTVLKRFSYRER
jgi:type IV pilus assembly protein PilY1